MCGIVGAVARRPASGILLEGLKRLEYRGYDSAGLALLDDGAICRLRTEGKVEALIKAEQGTPLAGTVGIAHTRWATHGPPCEHNAHPHISSGEVALVHNGIIENHAELRRGLEADNIVFESETDTEVVAHLIHREVARHGDLRHGVREVVRMLKGSYAIAVMHSRYPDRLVAARFGCPLVVGVGFGEHFIASDTLALRLVTDRFLILEENEVVEISCDSARIYNTDDEAVQRDTVRVDYAPDATDKGVHRHFMHKEIFEQPQAVINTMDGRLGDKHVLEQAFGVGASAVFDRARSVQIVACGTSYYAGLVARNWIEDVAGIPCRVEEASEYRYRQVAHLPDPLFVAVSQSGETADTLSVLRDHDRAAHVGTLTICNVATSSMVRESDLVFMTHAGPEIGVASTKAFTTQLIDLLLLAIVLGRRHRPDESREAELVEVLHALPDLLRETLKLDDCIARIAAKFAKKEHALFLGRGTHYPAAREGALKMKEISYIHAEAYPAGELKHGPLALVDEDMPVVAVAPSSELLEKLQSNLSEVSARGGELFVFADEAAGFEDSDRCTVIPVPHAHRIISPIVYTLPLQLLAYHVAVLRGTDVDQPRNLAKSVTVE